MWRSAAVSLVVLLTIHSVWGQVPKFENYAVGRVYNGRNARPVITKDDRVFRTRIRWAAANEKRDFAGEYILAQFGCGAECLYTFALNARTGRVAWLPFSICCWRPMDLVTPTESRLRSRLLVLRGLRSEGRGQFSGDARTDTHYYELRNGKFRHLRTVKQP